MNRSDRRDGEDSERSYLMGYWEKVQPRPDPGQTSGHTLACDSAVADVGCRTRESIRSGLIKHDLHAGICQTLVMAASHPEQERGLFESQRSRQVRIRIVYYSDFSVAARAILLHPFLLDPFAVKTRCFKPLISSNFDGVMRGSRRTKLAYLIRASANIRICASPAVHWPIICPHDACSFSDANFDQI